ncbi:MAG TPA: FG-GAP-like repeat-containing protein, partial [Bryobacteraceae bacterium]|nr:FG-GAP-like repeat-containing protein [Bryobacteraceae bacterium]
MSGRTHLVCALVAAALVIDGTAQAPSVRQTAMSFFEQRRFDHAAAAFNEYLKVKPEDDAARLLLGLSRQLSGDSAAAESEFRTVVGRKPTDFKARFFLARALLLNSKLTEAAETARRAGELGEAPARVHNLMGLVFEEQNRNAEALEAYSRAVTASKDFAEAHVNRGKLLLKLNRPGEASEDLKIAVKLDGGSFDGLHALARAQIAVGDHDQARALLKRAASLPGDTEAARQLLRRLEAGVFSKPANAMRTTGSRPAQSTIRFREAAQAFGLDLVLHNHPTAEKYLPETMAGGVAAFDYNNDGYTDLYFANGAELPSMKKSSSRYWNRLFRNDGGTKFVDVTQASGAKGEGFSIGIAAGDFDNDGYADLFVAGVRQNVLYRNRGDGTFEDITVAAGIGSEHWSVAAAWLDFDSDGLLDLFVVNYLDWIPENNVICSGGSSEQRVYCHPKHFKSVPNSLYRNLGSGRFQDVSAAAGITRHAGKGMSAAIADYDRDGRPDIFVTNDAVPNFLFRNKGDGTFEEVAVLAGVAFTEDGKSVSSMGAEFRDVDNDGLPDIAVTALERETFPLFQNQGRGFFRDATFASLLGKLSWRQSGWSNGLFDFDNDGWKDLFTANSHVTDNIEKFSDARYRLPNSVYQNAGNGTFRDASTTAGASFQRSGAHRGAAFADVNNDGRVDVIVSRLGETPELWLNETASTNNWVFFQLIGAGSNRDAIGAEVSIGSQHNHVTT